MILEIIIADVLKKIGCPVHLNGQRALRKLIVMVMERKGQKINFGQLYKELKLENEFFSNERVIRYAIEHIYKYGNTQYIQKIFGKNPNRKKEGLGVSYFVLTIADYIELCQRYNKEI